MTQKQRVSQFVDPDDIIIEGMHEEKLPAIIVDIDSTLALLGDRDPMMYEEAVYDELNHVVYRLMRKYEKDGYKIILLTGRPMKYAELTIDWLAKHAVHYDALIMREDKDKRKDIYLKHRAYNQYIKNKYEVELVLEDRTRVVKMWRSLGLTCFQVCEGDY